MSMNSWEGEVDSMINGDAADAAAKGKGPGQGGKNGKSGGDSLFQGLMQVLGVGNKPLGTKAAKAGQPTLTSAPVKLLNDEGTFNEAPTPDFQSASGSSALPMDMFGTPDLGEVAKKTDILSVALKAIGLGF